MKKKLTLFTVAALSLFALGACSTTTPTKKETSDSATKASSTTEAATNTEYKVGDTIVFKDKKLAYSNIYDVPLQYSKITKKIYIYKYCYACKERSKEYYSYSIISNVDPQTKETKEENA